jgi:hypothetical protein
MLAGKCSNNHPPRLAGAQIKATLRRLTGPDLNYVNIIEQNDNECKGLNKKYP